MNVSTIIIISISYILAFMVGGVCAAIIMRRKRRQARQRRAAFIAARNRTINASRELEQSAVRLSRAMRRSGITGVTVYKGVTENCDNIIDSMRGGGGNG